MQGESLRDDEVWARLSVVVPAFNEEAGVGAVAKSLVAAFPGAEIIIVDDGSTDRTAEVVGAVPGARLIRHPFNRGYGAALKTGMAAAGREFVAWFDSDGEHRIEDLTQMLRRLVAQRLAAVLGQRPVSSGPAVRRAGKWAIRLLVRSLGADAVPDLNCGLRVFRRDIVDPYLPILPDGFSASTTTTLILLERDYPIAFHPITTTPRSGTSKVVLADGFATMRLVLRLVTLLAPLRLFFPPGVILMALGLVYGLIIAFEDGTGFPIAALVGILGGLNLCVLGLVADQISQLRLSRRPNTHSAGRDAQ